jgi:hypothetical protein
MNNQVFKINDQYSVCLDEYFDINSLHDIFPNIVKGLILSKQYFEPIEIGNQNSILNKEHIAPELYIRDVFSKTEEYADLVNSGFTERQVHEYVLFRSPAKTLGTKLLLRTYPNYSKAFGAKHLARLNKDQPAYEYFPEEAVA